MDEERGAAPSGPPVTRRAVLAWTGAGIAGAVAAGCSGGGLISDPFRDNVFTRERLQVNTTRSVLTTDRGVQTSYLGFLGTGIGAFVALWGVQDASGAPDRVTQSLYWDRDPASGTRTVFDGQGLPVRIEHEENGAFVRIFWEPDRATFKFYQPGGAYVGGATVEGNTFETTQLADSQVVGFFTGTASGLRDGVVSFTVGGNTQQGTNRSARPAMRSTRQQEPPPGLDEATKAKALAATTALSDWAKGAQGGWAGRLLEAVGRPVFERKVSALGQRIVRTALAGTGLAPVFLRDGKPILDGLITPFLILGVTGKLAGATVANFPAGLGVSLAEIDPVSYSAANAQVEPRKDSDPTGIRGFAASRETGNVDLTGFIDSGGNVFLSGTATSGDLIEFTGLVSGTSIQGGRWKLRNAPGTTRDADGSWVAEQTPIGQCQDQQNSGRQGIFTNVYDLGKPGSFTFRYNAFSIPDQFQVFADGDLLFDTGGKVSGQRTVTLTASCLSTIIRVVVTADLSGTAWNYTVGCPQ
ncbi:MAG: hypothetical protein ACKO5K_08305 [Armatimonadota bacterium]